MLVQALGDRARKKTLPAHGDALSTGAASVSARTRWIAVELLGDVMEARGQHDMVALGGSMTPAIPSGCRVALLCTPAPTLGDVVAARLHGSLVIHRVVGLDAAGRVLLKGDSCPTPDGWIDPRDILGRVESIDDGSGPRPVPAASPPVPRWRRGLARLERAWRALT